MQFTRLNGSHIQSSQSLIKLFKCWAVLWNATKTIGHERLDLRRTTIRHRRSFIDVGISDKLDDFVVVFAFVRIFARIHFVQYYAKRKDVGCACVLRLAAETFGGHPIRGARSTDLLLLRQTKVSNLGAKFAVNEHILCLEVAMDDLRGSRV